MKNIYIACFYVKWYDEKQWETLCRPFDYKKSLSLGEEYPYNSKWYNVKQWETLCSRAFDYKNGLDVGLLFKICLEYI